MFIRSSTVLVSVIALAGAAVAAPSALEARTSSSQCDTGSIQCCNQTTDATSSLASILAGLLGINLSGITGTLGVSCTPIVGNGAVCTQQPTCCTGDSFSGLIVVGCSPINLNL